VHVHYLCNLHLVPKDYHFRKPTIVFAFVAINTWIWSAVFHARDTPLTEKLDYFFATFHVLFSTLLALMRYASTH
jgi:hypothetical protein